MKKFLFLFSAYFIIYSCNNTPKGLAKLTQLIPETTNIVLKINNLETFKSNLKNNAFISKLSSTSVYKDLLNQLKSLKYIATNTTILICFTNSNDKLDFSIITKYSDSLFKNKETDSPQLYSKIIDSIYVGSTSKKIIDQLKVKTNSAFERLYKVTKNNSSFSIFLSGDSSKNLGNALIPNAISSLSANKQMFSNWMSLNTTVLPDKITFNGISIAKDTVPQLITIFKNTVAQENTISHIAPINSSGFLSFTYNDFKVLQHNLSTYNKAEIDATANYELFETINEVGEIYMPNETIVVLHSIDISATKEALGSHQKVVSNFRNIAILEFLPTDGTDANPTLFKTIFSPFINTEKISKYINIEDFFVFSNSKTQLQNIITNYQNKTTLYHQNTFAQSYESLSNEASLLIVANPEKLKTILKTIFNDDFSNIKLNDYKTSAFQFIQDDGFVHINGIIKKNKAKAPQNSVTQEFNVSLDAELLTAPHFVINHRTKQKEIVVQDVENNLYLISNKGNVLWKKQLKGAILGTIKQVDLYKNRRLQLAFATAKRVYILDRNGKEVSPFPLHFDNDITQPLSVFDYDNKMDYRFLVAQGNALLMYNKKAKKVNGFKYKSTSTGIITQPKHFKIGNKDYIVFASGKQMVILNRKGQVRINVKEQINFSGNAIFKYKNKFTTTTSLGELVQVNLKGAVSKQALRLTKNHFIETTSKTLVTLSENKLSIKQKTIELDFGNYTAPRIFYINDIIYITLTDLQTHKVFLFNSKAQLLKNFPVYGNSAMFLDNINRDRNLEFVVKGESNSIIVYKKN